MNSINCIVRLSVGFGGGVLRYGSPLMHSKFGLSFALQWHLCCPHVQGRSHGGTVFSCGMFHITYTKHVDVASSIYSQEYCDTSDNGEASTYENVGTS